VTGVRPIFDKGLAQNENSSNDRVMHAVRHPQPDDVLGFWFSNHAMARWFAADTAFDGEIEALFEPLFEGVVKGAFSEWQDTAEGALALVILFDQFPRNMYRGQARSFAFDDRARAVARHAINHGFDLETPRERRLFFYLPFMHSENIDDQRACLDWVEHRLGEPSVLKAARDHMAMIERFGRFPQRNKILLREPTADELRAFTTYAQKNGLAALCRVLINSNEFLFVN